MADKIKFTVSMDVNISQAIALKAFFDEWTKLGKQGSSRYVGFYVDGDGDFKPNCEVNFENMEQYSDNKFQEMALIYDGRKSDYTAPSTTSIELFDFDNIAWYLLSTTGE